MRLDRGQGQRKGERGVSARDEVDQMLTLWIFHAKQQNIQFITVSFREQHHPRVFVEIRSSWQFQMSFISHLTSGLLCADLGWECSRNIVLVLFFRFALTACWKAEVATWNRFCLWLVSPVPSRGCPVWARRQRVDAFNRAAFHFHSGMHCVIPSFLRNNSSRIIRWRLQTNCLGLSTTPFRKRLKKVTTAKCEHNTWRYEGRKLCRNLCLRGLMTQT